MKDRLDWGSLAIAVLFCGAASTLLVTSPTQSNFWWSDAPRHALNGAFIRDAAMAFPWRHPMDWAVDYYLHYPALTILFYPPLFYLIEAVMFTLFGVSHFVAQATVTLFVLPLLWATYALSRRLLPRWSAAGASLLLVGAPEMAFWGRQVMLDIPAFAALAASAVFFLRYWTTRRHVDILLAAVLLVAAMWIKQTTAFIVPVFVLMAVASDGRRVLRDRGLRWAALVGVAGVVPLVLLTWRFGVANVESVAGRPGDLPLTSVEAWLFYGRLIPHDLGIVAAALSGIGLVLLIVARKGREDRAMTVFLLAWLAASYVFFSAIGVRQPRHGLMILMPLAIAAVYALHRILPSRIAPVAALVLGAGTFGASVVSYPPPHVDGYAAVADFVAAHAPENAVVMFHGGRDGNFVFALRARSPRRDIVVLRTDKILLRVVAGERERGVQQVALTEPEIAALVRNLGVNFIVVQPGFWNDLREMARFEAVLRAPGFERVAQFPISSTGRHDETAIAVYRPTYLVQRTQQSIQFQMPMLRGLLRGRLAPD
jgi:4-amino-4-deoxy-L-arabinose transferase-like glycosyltransferase